MTTLLIIGYPIAVIGSLMIATAIDNRIKYHKRENFISRITFGMALMILAFSLIIAIPSNCKVRLTENSECVVSFDKSTTIYHNNDTHEYFILRSNDWNLLNPHYRIYIDKEEAEELIKSVKVVNDWENKYK